MIGFSIPHAFHKEDRSFTLTEAVRASTGTRKSFILAKASLNGCFFFPLLLTETSPLQKDSKANQIYVQYL